MRITGGKAGQATVIQVLSSEDSVRLVLPVSTEVMIVGTRLNYLTEVPRLEVSGALLRPAYRRALWRKSATAKPFPFRCRRANRWCSR
jgi:hypothetical protein